MIEAIGHLRDQFDEAMFVIYKRAKSEAGYNANLFLNMLNRDGGLRTAQKLINASRESDGYTALWLRQRLDLTVEAMVLDQPRWHELFTADELTNCRERLAKCGYPFTP